jgi:hypothetical protein
MYLAVHVAAVSGVVDGVDGAALHAIKFQLAQHTPLGHRQRRRGGGGSSRSSSSTWRGGTTTTGRGEGDGVGGGNSAGAAVKAMVVVVCFYMSFSLLSVWWR